MSKRQRTALCVGICLAALAVLIPPWRLVRASNVHGFDGDTIACKGETVTLRYGWLFAPPHYTRRVYLHASRVEIRLYEAAKAAAEPRGDAPEQAEWDDVCGPTLYQTSVDLLEQRTREGKEQAALRQALKQDPRLIVKGFEDVHGEAQGPIEANYWWATVPWSAVEPRIDSVRLRTEWVLIAMVTGGVLLMLGDRELAARS